jgi:hypothetical protein
VDRLKLLSQFEEHRDRLDSRVVLEGSGYEVDEYVSKLRIAYPDRPLAGKQESITEGVILAGPLQQALLIRFSVLSSGRYKPLPASVLRR